ncbi:hypothetical protein FQN60_009733 [Etheostoma spectabile]|uniref:Uncharacterized protein n=1 Tax=Etheostoma spectabile TaxID=54343 RepID=A0A5J5DJP9_9PERO|nr:hypothetical protein FQN60_009733 [Etheostoma spectabile]
MGWDGMGRDGTGRDGPTALSSSRKQGRAATQGIIIFQIILNTDSESSQRQYPGMVDNCPQPYRLSDMVTSLSSYQVMPSPFSEDDLSESSSPRSCSSPDSQVLSSSYGSNSSAESQDSILDHLLSQASLGGANSILAGSEAPIALSTFFWDSRRDEPSKCEPVKEEQFDFLTWSNVETEEQLVGSFQPTLEEIEEFLEENMDMVTMKQEIREGCQGLGVGPEEVLGLEVGLEWCTDHSPESKLEPEATCSDHLATAAPSETKTTSVNHTHESSTGAKKALANKTPSADSGGMPVILQIQPLEIKQEPTVAPLTPVAQPPPPALASDIKIAQLLVNIQGQTFALVPHILPSPSLNVSSKFVRIAPIPIAAKPLGLRDCPASQGTGVLVGGQKFQKNPVVSRATSGKQSLARDSQMSCLVIGVPTQVSSLTSVQFVKRGLPAVTTCQNTSKSTDFHETVGQFAPPTDAPLGSPGMLGMLGSL